MRGPVVIRAPNHLGDLVMALPALRALPGADVVVARWLVPMLELALAGGEPRRIIAIDRALRGTAAAARAVRPGRYRTGILLTPSLSSAMVFAFGGVRVRRGTPTDGRRLLLTDPVPLEAVRPLHRAAAFWLLATGEPPPEPPVPRLEVPDALRERWRGMLPDGGGPIVGVFPGSNAPSRRWAAERYAALVRGLAEAGTRVVVFGASAERPLTARVAGSWAFDAGGRTDLPLLAAALAECALLVTNDSGPMHLAAAVGTPTVSLQGPADPRETRPLGEGHVLVQRLELPCVPCVRNVCPRQGAGYILAAAEQECLRLIEVPEVEAVVRAHPAAARPPTSMSAARTFTINVERVDEP